MCQFQIKDKITKQSRQCSLKGDPFCWRHKTILPKTPSIFNTDFVSTSTILSFLNFKEQAKMVCLSKITSQIINNDEDHKLIRKMFNKNRSTLSGDKKEMFCMDIITFKSNELTFKQHLKLIAKILQEFTQPNVSHFIRSITLSFPELMIILLDKKIYKLFDLDQDFAFESMMDEISFCFARKMPCKTPSFIIKRNEVFQCDFKPINLDSGSGKWKFFFDFMNKTFWNK